MFGIRTRTLAAAMVALITGPHALHAQWSPMGGDCSCYTPYVAAPAPVVTTACQCLQPVTQMVQKEVQVTAYREKQYTEEVPVQKLKYRTEKYTAYRPVMEARTVEVQAMTYQTVTEMVPRTINKSRWQTIVQPVPKMAPCQYDSRPGMIGSMNRMGYQMRTAFQPNYTTHRQFVPQVCQCNVPVQRQVAVPTTRKVVYNEMKQVAYEATRQVAYFDTEMQKQTVTRLEPYTTTRTVSVPTVQYAYVDPFGTVIAPSATRSAQEDKEPTRATEGDKLPGGLKSSSIQKNRAVPGKAEPTPVKERDVARVVKVPATTVAQNDDDGWKTHTPTARETLAPRSIAPRGKSAIVSNK